MSNLLVADVMDRLRIGRTLATEIVSRYGYRVGRLLRITEEQLEMYLKAQRAEQEAEWQKQTDSTDQAIETGKQASSSALDFGGLVTRGTTASASQPAAKTEKRRAKSLSTGDCSLSTRPIAPRTKPRLATGQRSS